MINELEEEKKSLFSTFFFASTSILAEIKTLCNKINLYFEI